MNSWPFEGRTPLIFEGTLFEQSPAGHRPAIMRPQTHRTFLVVLTGLLVLATSNFAQARPASPAPLLRRVTASQAIDRGVAVSNVETDRDDDRRPAGSASDVGADDVAAPIRSAFSGVSCKYGDAQRYDPLCSNNRPVER